MNAKARLLVFALFMAGMLGYGGTELLAAAISSTQSGNWNDASTWGGGPIPDNDDDVTIAAGHLVTVNGANEAQSIIVDGTLRPDVSPARTLAVGGNVTINAAGAVNYNNATGRLSWTITDGNITVAGATAAADQAQASFFDLTINGTTTTTDGFIVHGNFSTTAAGTFSQSTAQGEVMFTNTAEKTISNLGALTFGSVELSTGTEITTSSDFVVTDDLVTTAGSELTTTGFSVLTLSGGTVTNSGDITIGADATVGVQGATTLASSIDDMSGTFTVSGTTLTLGSSTITGNGAFQGASGMTLSLTNASGVAGAIATTTASLNANTNYIFTDGTSTTGFAGVSVTSVNDLTITHTGGAAVLNTAESFTITGDLNVSTADASFAASAGTITFGATGAITNTGGAIADLQLNDIVIGAGFTSTLTTLGFTSIGDMTIGAGSTLDMNTLDIEIDDASTITNNGTFTIDGDITLDAAASALTLGSNLTMTAAGNIILNHADASINAETFTITTSGAGAAELTLTNGTFISGNDAGVAGSIIVAAANDVTVDNDMSFTLDGAATATTLGLGGFAQNLAGDAAAGGAQTNLDDISNLTVSGAVAATTLGITEVMNISGNLIVNAGASLDIDGANDDQDITMTGTAVVTANGTLALQEFAVAATGVVTTSSSFSVTGLFEVLAGGSFIASAPSVVTLTTIAGSVITPDNAAGGTLTFYDLSLAGTGGDFAPDAEGDYTVARNWTLTAGNYVVANVGAQITMTGSPAVFETSGGTVTLGELLVATNAAVTSNDDINFIANGIFDNDGTFVAQETADIFSYAGAGTMSGDGITTLGNLTAGAAVGVTFTDSLYVNSDITGGGTYDHTGAGLLYMNGSVAQTISVATFQPNGLIIPENADVNITIATANNNTPDLTINGTADIDAAVTFGNGSLNVGSTATLEVGVAGGLATTFVVAAGTTTAISSQASYIFDAAGAVGIQAAAAAIIIDGGGADNTWDLLGNVTFGAQIEASATDNFTVNGNVNVIATGDFDGSTNAVTVTLAGTTKTIDNTGGNSGTATDLTFGNLTVSGSYTLLPASTNGFLMGTGAGDGILTIGAAGSLDLTTATAATTTTFNTTSAAIVNSASATDLIFDNVVLTAINAASTAADFYINGLTVTNAAPFASTGTLFFGETTTITTGAAFEASQINVVAGGTLTFADGTNGPQINETLTVDGTLDINGADDADRLIVDEGTIAGTGTINITGLEVTTGPVTTTADITIDGPLATLTEALDAAFAFTASTPSTITIAATGANDFLDAAAITTFNNLVFSGAATTNDANFTITGDLTVNNGASIVSDAGTVLFDGATDKNIVNNGTLTFFELDIANTADNNLATTSSFSVAGTTGSDLNVIGTTGGTFSATNGTVTFSGAAGGITNGSDNATRAQLSGLAFTGATNTITADDLINVSGDINFGNATSFTHTSGASGRITLNGSGQQTITVNKAMTGQVNLENLTLNNSNGARLASSTAVALTDTEFEINRRLLLTNGDFDLNGDNVITIDQTNGRLQETAGNTVINTGIPSATGYVAASNAGGANLINTNIGGLGARISTDAAPGAVTVRRYHKPATVGGEESISRYYRITSVSGSLNSTLTLAYDDSELGSIAEADLLVFNSADVTDFGANPWVNRVATHDVANNSFRTRSIDTYQDSTVFWALAAPNVITASEVTGVSKGLSASPLTATADSVVLYGLKMTPAGGEVILDGLTFTFNRALNAGTAELGNYKLFVSEDNDFQTTSDNTFLATTPTGGGAGNTSIALDITTNQTLSEAVDYHYFLVADVAANVTAATTALTVSMDNFGINLTQGVVKTYSEAGTAYSFIPGFVLDYLSNGVSDAPIVAGQDNNVIFGFEIESTSAANFTGFDLNFSSDIENVLENPRVYVSTDASYTTTADNSLVTLSGNPTISGSMITFAYNSSQSTNTTQKNYFVVVDAKGGIDELTSQFSPMLYHDSIVSTTAQPTFRTERNGTVYADVVTGQSYDFVRNTVTVSNTTTGINPVPPANGNISKGVINQTLMGFTLTSDNEVSAQFDGVTAHVTLASGAVAADFRDWRLWSDANGNGYGDSGEQIAVGTLNTGAGEGNLSFSSFSSAQTVTSASEYIITAEVRTTATAGGTITLSIPSSAYVSVVSPATVNDGGPYTANLQTVRTAGAATQLALVGDYARSVTTGGDITFTMQARDASGYPTNVSSATSVNMTLVNNDGGESTIGGTTTGSIANGRSYTTITPTFTDADGSTVTTIRTNDVAATLTSSAASETITILTAEPTTDANTLVLAAGATPTTEISVSSWANGDGAQRIIVMRAGKMAIAPTDGIDYTPSLDVAAGYNSVNQTGAGSYVVYDGSGASAGFTVTGLTPNTKYYFTVFEYNGTGGVTNYKDITFSATNPASITTASGNFGTIADSTSAASIETNVDITGTLTTTGDKDWYQFNVPADKNNVMVRLTNLPANYSIELYDRTTGALQDMTLIRQGESTGNGNETMILNDAANGRYLIKIYGNDSDQFSTSAYTLRVNTSRNQLYSLPAGN